MSINPIKQNAINSILNWLVEERLNVEPNSQPNCDYHATVHDFVRKIDYNVVFLTGQEDRMMLATFMYLIPQEMEIYRNLAPEMKQYFHGNIGQTLPYLGVTVAPQPNAENFDYFLIEAGILFDDLTKDVFFQTAEKLWKATITIGDVCRKTLYS